MSLKKCCNPFNKKNHKKVIKIKIDKVNKFLTEIGEPPIKIKRVSSNKECQNDLTNKKDFNVDAEWNFFATSHGKGACDGLAGSFKRQAFRASLQRESDKHITNATSLFEWETCEDCFICASKKTIYSWQECDGKKNCDDGSDELHNNSPCKGQMCPNDHKACNYGACIPITEMCNNHPNDCADNSDEWKYNCKIHPTDPEKFKSCESGEFIKQENFCDKQYDCKDGSDENYLMCKFRNCPPTHFSCNSGQCILSNKRCDSIHDCNDKSDEIDCVEEPKVQDPTVSIQGCAIKNDPNYYITNERENYKIYPGDLVSVDTRIIIKCKNNSFFRETESQLYRICKKDGEKYEWNNPLPDCIKYCNANILHNSKSTVASCKLHGTNVSCDKIEPDTIAKVECADSYEIPQTQSSYEMTCTPQGSWTIEKINCQPICGQSTYIQGASEAPWHVGVKTYLNQTCGGTIVSPRSVITALHCVQNEDEEVLSVSNVLVIIASITVNVSEIFGGGQIDVAILKLREILTFSKDIRPICITQSNVIVNSIKAFIHDGHWGKTVLDVLPHGSCGFNLNGSYICVRPNYQLNQTRMLCEGHSGTGIIVKNEGDDVNYIIGILSYKPSPVINCTNEPIVAIRIPEKLLKAITEDEESMSVW